MILDYDRYKYNCPCHQDNYIDKCRATKMSCTFSKCPYVYWLERFVKDNLKKEE